VAGLAAIPYLLFTDVNYLDYPFGSGNFMKESAFCALLDINISPTVYYRLLYIVYIVYIQCETSIFEKVFIWFLGQPVQWFGRNQIYLKLKLGARQFMPGIKNLNLIFV
jgi:hypothetical protein